MNLASLLEEYSLTLDDVRWYRSRLLAESLLLDREDPIALTRRIWSGELENQLYDMEERYLKRLDDELNRGLTDEQAVRDQMEEARLAKLHRPR